MRSDDDTDDRVSFDGYYHDEQPDERGLFHVHAHWLDTQGRMNTFDTTIFAIDPIAASRAIEARLRGDRRRKHSLNKLRIETNRLDERTHI